MQLIRTTFWYSNQLQHYAEEVVSAAEAEMATGDAMQYAYGALMSPEGGAQAISSQVRCLDLLLYIR